MNRETQKLWDLCDPVVRDAGFEVCEVQWGREQSGWVLRLYLDSTTSESGVVGPPVTHEDCERVSRDLSAALDVANAITHPYSLEVSSPGLDRPLRRIEDFARFAGSRAKVRMAEGVEGRRSFAGLIRGIHDRLVELECDGRVFALPVDDVARANLIPDWEAEFKNANAARSAP